MPATHTSILSLCISVSNSIMCVADICLCNSETALNLLWACADERTNADDMVDILELVPEAIRAAINAHLDSMNSLYPIRSDVASLLALIASSQGCYQSI